MAALSIVGGAAAGLLSSAILFRTGEIHTHHPAPTSTKSEPSMPRPLIQSPVPQNWSTVQTDTAPASPPPQVSPSDEPIAELDPEVAAEILRTEFRRDIQNHESDARDPDWATDAEGKIHASMDTTDGGHEVLKVDCRMTSCIVDLQWPSRADALQGFGSVLAAHIEPNCATKILLHEDGPGEGPFQEKLILDCTESRLGEL